MGSSVSAFKTNNDLIDDLISNSFIRSGQVEKVMRAVDRAYFQEYRRRTGGPYLDAAWRKGSLHISAPCIYGEALEALALETGHSFLNLGSGTGYFSTVVGLLVGMRGLNHGVEQSKKAVEYARKCVDLFKENSKSALDPYDFCEPIFTVGDCMQLAPETQRYDRIYCGAAFPLAHETYLKQLLKVGGILVVPLDDRLMRITRFGEGIEDFREVEIMPVCFSHLLPCPGVADPVRFPDHQPYSLQELARMRVRECVRANLMKRDQPICANREVSQVRICRKRKLSSDALEMCRGLGFADAFYDSDDDSSSSSDSSLAQSELSISEVEPNLTDLDPLTDTSDSADTIPFVEDERYKHIELETDESMDHDDMVAFGVEEQSPENMRLNFDWEGNENVTVEQEADVLEPPDFSDTRQPDNESTRFRQSIDSLPLPKPIVSYLKYETIKPPPLVDN